MRDKQIQFTGVKNFIKPYSAEYTAQFNRKSAASKAEALYAGLRAQISYSTFDRTTNRLTTTTVYYTERQLSHRINQLARRFNEHNLRVEDAKFEELLNRLNELHKAYTSLREDKRQLVKGAKRIESIPRPGQAF